MEKRDRLPYYSRDQLSESDWKKSQSRHSTAKRSIHKKHSKHHPRYSSSETDAKRASYEENPLNWNECLSSLGRKYWFNVRTEKSQWEVPKAILLQRSRERETSKKEFSPPYYSGSNRKSSHVSDYHTSSPRKRDDDVDKPSLLATPDSPRASSSSRSLITSLHPLQQALLVKNQLQHSTVSTRPQTLPISPSTVGPADSNPLSPPELVVPPLPRPEFRHAPLPARTDTPATPSAVSQLSKPAPAISSLSNQLSGVASNLDKFANTPGIRIRKKLLLSTSSASEETLKLISNSDTIPSVDIVIPESPTELLYDPELMNMSLIYPFSSPHIDYTEKEINNRMLERLNLTYPEQIESSLMLTSAKLRWEIDNFASQMCALRAASIASLIEQDQSTVYK